MKDETHLHPITRALTPIIEGMCSKRVVVAQVRHDVSLYEIKIAPAQEDYCIICGRNGRQIRALKYIAATIGHRRGENISVTLEESFDPKPIVPRPYSENKKFDRQKFLKLLNGMLQYLFDPMPKMRVSSEHDRIKVYIEADKSDRQAVVTIVALGDIFYPWGIANGMKVEIKTPKAE